MSSKDETKSKDETVSVNVDEFTKTRDSVLLSLAQLQAAVSDLSRAYINHTNTVLKREEAAVDISRITSITNTLYESGLLGDAPAPGATGDKRKRKRAPHDPNAPKRALTPFFLYMQHNRAQIGKEMGPDAKPKDVSDEGTKRWQSLSETQKEIWRKMYADNLESYRQKMKAYKAGLPVPDDDSAQAENQLQQSAAAADHTDSEQSSEEEGESEEESSPSPAKEPTPPRSNKRRRSEAKTTAAATPSKEPEKKKRGAAKKDKEEETASARKTGSESTKRTTKKKRKSEAGE